jgi:hypothetical protein
MCFEFENLPIEFDPQGNPRLEEERFDPCGKTPLARPLDDDPNKLRELLFERHISVVVHCARRSRVEDGSSTDS